jgi:hypothetical protein
MPMSSMVLPIPPPSDQVHRFRQGSAFRLPIELSASALVASLQSVDPAHFRAPVPTTGVHAYHILSTVSTDQAQRAGMGAR